MVEHYGTVTMVYSWQEGRKSDVGAIGDMVITPTIYEQFMDPNVNQDATLEPDDSGLQQVKDRKKRRFGSKIHVSSSKVFEGDYINDGPTFSTMETESSSAKNL